MLAVWNSFAILMTSKIFENPLTPISVSGNCSVSIYAYSNTSRSDRRFPLCVQLFYLPFKFLFSLLSKSELISSCALLVSRSIFSELLCIYHDDLHVINISRIISRWFGHVAVHFAPYQSDLYINFRVTLLHLRTFEGLDMKMRHALVLHEN